MLSKFYKVNPNDKIWRVKTPDRIGEHLFTFDKKKIYNMFRDYPYNMTDEEVDIFQREYPFWADFFSDRIKPGSAV